MVTDDVYYMLCVGLPKKARKGTFVFLFNSTCSVTMALSRLRLFAIMVGAQYGLTGRRLREFVRHPPYEILAAWWEALFVFLWPNPNGGCVLDREA